MENSEYKSGIDINMFEEIIVEQNAHWRKKEKIKLIEREKFTILKKYLDLKHIVTITRIRICGKSYLLNQLINYSLN